MSCLLKTMILCCEWAIKLLLTQGTIKRVTSSQHKSMMTKSIALLKKPSSARTVDVPKAKVVQATRAVTLKTQINLRRFEIHVVSPQPGRMQTKNFSRWHSFRRLSTTRGKINWLRCKRRPISCSSNASKPPSLSLNGRTGSANTSKLNSQSTTISSRADWLGFSNAVKQSSSRKLKLERAKIV